MVLRRAIVGKLAFVVSIFFLLCSQAFSCDAVKDAISAAEKAKAFDNEERKTLAIRIEKALLACAPPKLTRLVDNESGTEPVTSADQIEGAWLSTLISPVFTGLTVPKTYVLFVQRNSEDTVELQLAVFNGTNSLGFGSQKGQPFIDIARTTLKLSNGVAREIDFQRNSLDFFGPMGSRLIHNLIPTDFEGFTRLGLVSPNTLLTIDAVASEGGPFLRPRTWVRTSRDTLEIMEMLASNGVIGPYRSNFCLNEIVPNERFEKELAAHGLVRNDLIQFQRESRAIEVDRRLPADPDHAAVEKFGIDLPAFMLETSRRYNDVDPRISAFLEAQIANPPNEYDPLCPKWYVEVFKNISNETTENQ